MNHTIIILTILLLLLSACQQAEIKQEESVTIQQEPGPNIEKEQQTQYSTTESQTIATQKTVMQELLGKTPQTYWFSDNSGSESIGGSVFVSGTKRSNGIYQESLPDFVMGNSIYWNTETKIIYALTDKISKTWWNEHYGSGYEQKNVTNTERIAAFIKIQFTGDKEKDKKLIPKVLNKILKPTQGWYLKQAIDNTQGVSNKLGGYGADLLIENKLIKLFEDFYTKSPIDWMTDYSNETPLKIDTNPQLLPFGIGTTKSSDLSMYYEHKENKNWQVIFRFFEYKFKDETYLIPTLIEITNKADGKKVNRLLYYFGVEYTGNAVFYKNEAGQTIKQNERISDKVVELPKNIILITPEQLQEWIDQKGKR